MDIVDIDKVLDDLELDEDQHVRTVKSEAIDTKASISTESASASAHRDHFDRENSSQNKRDESDDLTASQTHCHREQQKQPNGTLPMVPSSHTRQPTDVLTNSSLSSPSPSGHVAVTQQPPPPNRMTKSNYVNVSNVFHSLNEYMNAGVEAVKIIEESSQAWDSSAVAVASIDENNISNTINGSEVVQSMPTNEQVTVPHSHSDIESTSASQSASTSSASSTCSSSELLDTGTNTMDQPNESAANESLNGSQSAVDHTSVTCSSLSIAAPTSSFLSSNNNSSIMQPTTTNTIPAMPTEEEVEGNDYVNNGGTDDIEDANNGEQVDGVKRRIATQKEEVSRADVDTDVVTDDKIKNIAQPAVMSALMGAAEVEKWQNDRFIKPLCFETAATMDDVSDTELESYLQELEDLEASPDIIRCENVPIAAAAATNTDNLEIDFQGECDADGLADSNHSEIDENDNDTEDIENRVNVKDDRNADSFSQASTVEFADINAENLNFASNKDDKTSEFDDHEQSVDPDASHEIENVDADVCVAVEPVDEGENKFEQAAIDREAEVATHSTTPKRPNTLELPSSLNETGRKMEVGTTPGTDLPSPENEAVAAADAPTPSSSSEESNMMLTDTSVRSEDATHSQCDSDADIDAVVAASDTNNVAAAQSASATTSTSPTDSSTTAANISINNLGKVQPYWVPDNMTMFCMQCNQKFSFIKRRHHCRACGQVLCSTCCSLKAKLEYMGDVEARICVQCDILLNNRDEDQDYAASGIDVASAIDANAIFASSPGLATRSPNPNNPMEYCSVIPPHQQVTSASTATPISVMVPVGVLKREGAPPKTARKEVMFSDGIRPGCDLTELDNSWTPTRSSSSDGNGNIRKSTNRRVQTPPGSWHPTT